MPPELVWEKLESTHDLNLFRAPIPGGWLVVIHPAHTFLAQQARAVTFVPDPSHEWDGGSVKPRA